MCVKVCALPGIYASHCMLYTVVYAEGCWTVYLTVYCILLYEAMRGFHTEYMFQIQIPFMEKLRYAVELRN